MMDYNVEQVGEDEKDVGFMKKIANVGANLLFY